MKSEHIPMVVFELPALQVLDLESTKLNTLPDIYNIQLREFYLCKNFLQVKITRDMFYCLFNPGDFVHCVSVSHKGAKTDGNVPKSKLNNPYS